AAHRGGGRASDGERRTSARRRTASDGDCDEHGVAGAGAVIAVTATHLAAGDTVRAAQSFEPSRAAQMEERSRPARGDITNRLCLGRLGKHAGRGVATESGAESE